MSVAPSTCPSAAITVANIAPVSSRPRLLHSLRNFPASSHGAHQKAGPSYISLNDCLVLGGFNDRMCCLTVCAVHDINPYNPRELGLQSPTHKLLQCESCLVSSQLDSFLAVFIYSPAGIRVVSSSRYGGWLDIPHLFSDLGEQMRSKSGFRFSMASVSSPQLYPEFCRSD